MNYFARFASYLGLLLIAFFFIGFGLQYYSENQPKADYQTQLVKVMSQLERPLIVSTRKQATAQWTRVQYTDSRWLAGKNRIPIADWLQGYRAPIRLLLIQSTPAHHLSSLRQALKKDKHWKNTIICSRADGLLSDLRNLEAKWTYCSGEVFMTRMLSLSSLGLSGLSAIRSDIFFIHTANINVSDALKPVIAGAKKQGKMVFVGPVSGPIDGIEVDGWLVEIPH